MTTSHFPRKTARQRVTRSVFSANYKLLRPKLGADLSYCQVYYLAYGKWAINIFKGQYISPVDFPYGRKNDARVQAVLLRRIKSAPPAFCSMSVPPRKLFVKNERIMKNISPKHRGDQAEGGYFSSNNIKIGYA